MLEQRDVVRVRGGNGAVFDVTVPADGTIQRELFDAKVARGDLIVVDVETAPRRSPRKPTEASG